jgi:hypothetical protein
MKIEPKPIGFIKEVKGYLCLNRDIASYNSPIKRVTFMLTLIKGEDIQGWICDMGIWLDTLDAAAENVSLLVRLIEEGSRSAVCHKTPFE